MPDQSINTQTSIVSGTTSRRRITSLLTAFGVSAVGTRLTGMGAGAKRTRKPGVKCKIKCSLGMLIPNRRCTCCRFNGAACPSFHDCCSGICSGTETAPGQCVGRATATACTFDAQCASGVCTAKRTCA